MNHEEELAYIGGLMDGDGSFSLTRKKGKKDQSCLYVPLVQYGSLSKQAVEFLKEKLGGSYSLQKSHTKKDGSLRRDFYHWRISNAKCISLIDELSPYLEIKKERAEFLKSYILRNPFKRGSVRLSKEVLESREKDYFIMKNLNDERTLEKSLIKQSKIITENKFFWAYFSGLLDSDGSFSIKKEKTGRYTAQILLTMTDIRSINKIRKNIFLGTVFPIKAKSTRLGKCYRYGVYRRKEISLLLPYVIPFLRIKKEQAKILLEFCNDQKIVAHRRNGIPLDEKNFRQLCYEKIIMLNKYGVYKPSLIDLEAQAGDRAEGLTATVND